MSGAPTIDTAALQSAIGRREESEDTAVISTLLRAAATLDRDDPVPRPGDPLPWAWHWFFLLPSQRQSLIGEDGHPKLGGFLPALPLPNRMWAGGRLELRAPLRAGERLRRISEIVKIEAKSGRTGPLVFVTLRHTVSGESGVATVEEQDLVYRGEVKGGAALPPTPMSTTAQWSRRIVTDAVQLFRFSALTFNGHRIHYDRPYCTGELGHPGLVVHGPFTLILLLDLLRREAPDAIPTHVDYRMMRPLFDVHPFTVNGRRDGASGELWAADHEGNLATKASVRFG